MPLFPPNAMRELAIPSPFAYCSAATVERLPLPMVMTVRPVDTYGFAHIGGATRIVYPYTAPIRVVYGSYRQAVSHFWVFAFVIHKPAAGRFTDELFAPELVTNVVEVGIALNVPFFGRKADYPSTVQYRE